ncbi:MAG: hypothetical protein V4719_16105 [Planctomycetota bacterium]
MRTIFIVLTGSAFLAIGYLYPIVVVFRGGTLQGLIGKIWIFLIAYFVVLSIGFAKVVALFDPLLAAEIDQSWVPDTPGLVPLIFMGWSIPVIGGLIGYVLRSISWFMFPKWMRRISIADTDPHGLTWTLGFGKRTE